MCGSGGTQVSTTNVEPWAEQKGYLTGGFEQAKNIFDRGAPRYYPGETIAGFDPAQKLAQEKTLQYATGPRPHRQQRAAETSLIQGLSGQIDPNAYNPMVNALTSNVIGNLQKNVLPGIRQQQVMYQPGGSSRAGLQQNRAVTDAVTSGMTKPIADMYTNAYNQAQNRAVQSGSLYPSIMNAPLALHGAIGQVGADRRAMTQGAIDRDMARYEYEANAPGNALRNYMAMVSGDYGSTTTATTPGPSGLSQLGQIAGIAGSLGFSPFSDARLKDNVTRIGKDEGYNVYTWEWNDKAKELGIDSPTVGVMAQEVLETNPDAISVDENGYYRVNYGAL